VIVAARRTPIGRAVRGSLASVRADDLMTTAIRAVLADVPSVVLAELDDLIVGAWLHTGDQGGNLARRVAVLLGEDALPGTTVNRACTSSLQALRMATHAIRSGEGRAFVIGGVESISHYASPRTGGATPITDRHPVFQEAAERSGARFVGDGVTNAWHDPRRDGFVPDVHLAMGLTAENVASIRRVSRADQDAFALLSQQRAARSIADDAFGAEIAPVTLADGTTVVADDSPRPDTTADDLAALEPAFLANGTVTAGNCCPLSDGAAAVVVTSASFAAERGLPVLARVASTGLSALSPEVMGLGPVASTRQALERAGMTSADLDLVELNEAFAAQVLPCLEDLALPVEKVNVNGGAIALGHPFGMGGARLTTTLVHAMQRHDASAGLVAMCAAGGQGMSIVLTR
jgi:acetyl-CoA C-acetyltransferase